MQVSPSMFVIDKILINVAIARLSFIAVSVNAKAIQCREIFKIILAFHFLNGRNYGQSQTTWCSKRNGLDCENSLKTCLEFPKIDSDC